MLRGDTLALRLHAAVVEVELLVLGDDRARVDGGAEVEPALRQAADDPGLGGERDLLEEVLLLATAATASGMPMPRLTTPPIGSSKAQRRAMTLRSSSGQGRDSVERHPELAQKAALKAVA